VIKAVVHRKNQSYPDFQPKKMKRHVYQELEEWKKQPNRKPIILRGARQVGKTFVVRQFSAEFSEFVEINFEKQANLHALFEQDLDAIRLVRELSLALGQEIVPGETLLFFDEVQICPKALLSLRYFYEQVPELHLIAAGSLLDIAIEQVGVPVGRVSFLYMYPLSFIEFLWAQEETLLADEIVVHKPEKQLNEAIHHKALKRVGEYMAIGGMPEAVKIWRDTQDYKQCLAIHHDILTAYRQDFGKYAKDSQIKYIEHLFAQVPYQLGSGFAYSKVEGEFRKRELAPCLQLLQKAKVLSVIEHTAAQGLPLGAQADAGKFKVIMLDIALTQALLGQTAESWILDPEQSMMSKGAIAEAFVGQELLAYSAARMPAQLYYWQCDKRGDYQINGDRKVMCFDEIQNIDKWELFVRRMMDAGIKFYMTGSNASLLSQELATRLTGRNVQLELLPYSFLEFLQCKQYKVVPNDLKSTPKKALIKQQFNTFLSQGGMPEHLQYDMPDVLTRNYDEIIFRDIVARYNIKDIAAFRRLALYLFNNFSARITLNSLKPLVNVKSTTTLSNYVYYLENSYLIFTVKQFSYSMKQQNLLPKKLYVIDNAMAINVAMQFSKNEGRLLENIVFLELRRQFQEIYYYQTQEGFEVDFLVFEKGKASVLFQVCYNLSALKTRERELRALVAAMDETKLKEAWIISYEEEETLTLEHKTIHIVPAYKWLLQSL
jgi:predicted AAA+ superfamily ATPase